MDDDGGDIVIELKRRSVISELLDDDDGPEPGLREHPARSAAGPGREATPAGTEQAGEPDAAAEAEELPSLDKLSHLPRPGDAYKAHARPVPKGLPMLCLLAPIGTRPAHGPLLRATVRWMRMVDGPPGEEPGPRPPLHRRRRGPHHGQGPQQRLPGYLYLHRLAWLARAAAGQDDPRPGGHDHHRDHHQGGQAL